MSDDVTLTIGPATFKGFTTLFLESAIDNVADGFSLTGAFDPNNSAMVSALKPFGYQRCTIKIGDELMLTGLVDKITLDEKENEKTFNLEGRSLAGQLVDCYIDGSPVKYEFTGLKLSEIAKKLCTPFGINVIVGLDTVETRTVVKEKKVTTGWAGSGGKADAKTLSSMDNILAFKGATTAPVVKTQIIRETVVENTLKEAKARPGQKVFDFLNELANRKKILLTSSPQGDLVLRQPAGTGQPTAAIIEGTSPYITGSAGYDGTARFSKYKVLHQESGSPSVVGTCDDSRVSVYRPMVDTESEAESQDITTPAKWIRAHAYAKAVGVNITLSGWRNADGMLWRKSDVVTLKAPSLMIPNEATFIIAGVSLRLANDGRTTQLRLVLPATYTGELPGGFPWD